MISFSQFLTDVKALAFPNREAARLQTLNRNYVENALIKLQTFIPCLKTNHVNSVLEADMRQSCRVATFTQEMGTIQAVYAFKPGSACKRFFYEMKSPNDIACWITKQAECCTIKDDAWPNQDLAQTDACTTLEDGYECKWKQSKKIFSILPGNRVSIAPAPPCDYVVVVHWAGIKRKWGNSDLLPDDQDLKNAVSLWVEYQNCLRNECDPATARSRQVEFDSAAQEIWFRCREETRQRNVGSPCFGDVAAYWDATDISGQDTENGSTTTTTTSSSSTTTTTTTSDGGGEETTTGEFTTNPVAFCITEFECLGTAGSLGEGDVVGEFGEFDYNGTRGNLFTSDREECDYKFRFVIDFGSGGRLDKLEIRITQYDGQETNERWSTDDVGTYPLALYASPLNLMGGPIVSNYITAPFSNANSLGEYTGVVEFFAYGQIFNPANQTLAQHFRLTATVANISADPGENAIENTAVVYQRAVCTSECGPQTGIYWWIPAGCVENPTGSVFLGGDAGGQDFNGVPPSDEYDLVGQNFVPCGEPGQVLRQSDGYGLTYPDFEFTPLSGSVFRFCDGVWSVFREGDQCPAEAATQEPLEAGNLPAAPQCANTGPYIESAEWECVAGGWELTAVTPVAGTITNIVPPLGTIFPENQEVVVLAEIQIGEELFNDTITYRLGECATATTQVPGDCQFSATPDTYIFPNSASSPIIVELDYSCEEPLLLNGYDVENNLVSSRAPDLVGGGPDIYVPNPFQEDGVYYYVLSPDAPSVATPPTTTYYGRSH